MYLLLPVDPRAAARRKMKNESIFYFLIELLNTNSNCAHIYNTENGTGYVLCTVSPRSCALSLARIAENLRMENILEAILHIITMEDATYAAFEFDFSSFLTISEVCFSIWLNVYCVSNTVNGLCSYAVKTLLPPPCARAHFHSLYFPLKFLYFSPMSWTSNFVLKVWKADHFPNRKSHV